MKKKIFKLSNLIPLLLVVYIAKSFIVQSGFFDFGVISIMSGLFLNTMKLAKKELSDTEELKSIISQLEEKVNEKVAQIEKQQLEDQLINNSKFSTLNIGYQNKEVKKQNNKGNNFSGW